MPHFTHERLHVITSTIFEAAGVPTDEAVLVADSLVDGNLCGHDSHGAVRIPQYITFMNDGKIVSGAPLIVVNETDATALLDGGWGFGQVQARRMGDIAVSKATAAGVATVSLYNCNHVGRLGEYLERIARLGFMVIGVVNNHGTGHITAPYGGWQPRLSTNPIAFAAPVAGGDPIVLDITTSVTAEGKIRVRKNKGEKVPEGWIMDNKGQFTTNAADLYTEPRGAVMPFGAEVAYKGFGLSMMVDILAGGLGAGGCSRPGPTRLGNQFTVVVIDPARFSGRDHFTQQTAELVAHCKSSKLRDGFDEILVPGEPEARCRKQRLEAGIDIDDETWRQICDAARSVGATFDELPPA